MGQFADMLKDYIAAFNRGDEAAYAAFYAPNVVLVNGGGAQLCGREAIAAFYAGFRKKAQRTIIVQAVIEGQNTIAAAFSSRFTALADDVELGGEVLQAGEAFELRSMALYELKGGLFSRIHSTSLHREIIRKGPQ